VVVLLGASKFSTLMDPMNVIATRSLPLRWRVVVLLGASKFSTLTALMNVIATRSLPNSYWSTMPVMGSWQQISMIPPQRCKAFALGIA